MQAMKRWAIWEAREERKQRADLQQHQPGVLYVDEKRPGPDLSGASLGVLHVPTTAATQQPKGRRRAAAAVEPSAFAAAAGKAGPQLNLARQDRGGLARGDAAPAGLQEKAMSAPPDLQRLPVPPRALPALPEAALGVPFSCCHAICLQQCSLGEQIIWEN